MSAPRSPKEIWDEFVPFARKWNESIDLEKQLDQISQWTKDDPGEKLYGFDIGFTVGLANHLKGRFPSEQMKNYAIAAVALGRQLQIAEDLGLRYDAELGRGKREQLKKFGRKRWGDPEKVHERHEMIRNEFANVEREFPDDKKTFKVERTRERLRKSGIKVSETTVYRSLGEANKTTPKTTS